MVRAILTDIEGTTSSISFVKEVLFPYAAHYLPAYVREHADEPVVAEQLQAVRVAIKEPEADTDRVIAVLLNWIREDRKATPLKTLQGMVWKHGYQSGAYQAHVYPDAAQKLREWHAQGLPIYIYSSGSIAAQKLFFKYSGAGDLTPLFSGYFDTTTGPKQEQASYAAIVQAIGLPAQEILFLSDVAAELDAAKAAGLQTCWLVRPQDNPQNPAVCAQGPHPAVTSFNEIRVNP
ncbi:MAG: acireductone synthase [Gammaproteobacteria bacterium]|nr:MAG: acireductone synthase [Gammaproteobacteria bacterium]